jgi:hypothetical protein
LRDAIDRSHAVAQRMIMIVRQIQVIKIWYFVLTNYKFKYCVYWMFIYEHQLIVSCNCGYIYFHYLFQNKVYNIYIKYIIIYIIILTYIFRDLKIFIYFN